MEFAKQLKITATYTWRRDKNQPFDWKGSEKSENNASFVSGYC